MPRLEAREAGSQRKWGGREMKRRPMWKVTTATKSELRALPARARPNAAIRPCRCMQVGRGAWVGVERCPFMLPTRRRHRGRVSALRGMCAPQIQLDSRHCVFELVNNWLYLPQIGCDSTGFVRARRRRRKFCPNTPKVSEHIGHSNTNTAGLCGLGVRTC